MSPGDSSTTGQRSVHRPMVGTAGAWDQSLTRTADGRSSANPGPRGSHAEPVHRRRVDVAQVRRDPGRRQPVRRSVVQQVDVADDADVQRAIAAARRAFDRPTGHGPR